MTPVRRLHIGGTVRKEGWEVYNIVSSDYAYDYHKTGFRPELLSRSLHKLRF